MEGPDGFGGGGRPFDASRLDARHAAAVAYVGAVPGRSRSSPRPTVRSGARAQGFRPDPVLAGLPAVDGRFITVPRTFLAGLPEDFRSRKCRCKRPLPISRCSSRAHRLGRAVHPRGLRKLTDLAAFAATLKKQGVPLADVLAPIGAAVEFFGGIAVLVGVQRASPRC